MKLCDFRGGIRCSTALRIVVDQRGETVRVDG